MLEFLQFNLWSNKATNLQTYLYIFLLIFLQLHPQKLKSNTKPPHYEGVPDISAHIPLSLLCETWMIWLFDDSLFLKSVWAPYVSNKPLAATWGNVNAAPSALWEAGPLFKPGGSIVPWTQTYILTALCKKHIWRNSSACWRKHLSTAVHPRCLPLCFTLVMYQKCSSRP